MCLHVLHVPSSHVAEHYVFPHGRSAVSKYIENTALAVWDQALNCPDLYHEPLAREIVQALLRLLTLNKLLSMVTRLPYQVELFIKPNIWDECASTLAIVMSTLSLWYGANSFQVGASLRQWLHLSKVEKRGAYAVLMVWEKNKL